MQISFFFLSNTLHIPLNIEILCKNSVGQNHSNLELSFYIMQDSTDDIELFLPDLFPFFPK